MSLDTNKRRLDRLEQRSGGIIAADQRDPELNEFLQQVFGSPPDSAPLGVSCRAFVKELVAGCQGTGLQPVKEPPGGWPAE